MLTRESAASHALPAARVHFRKKDLLETFGMLAEASDKEIALHSKSENSTAPSKVFVVAPPWSHAEALSIYTLIKAARGL